MASSLWLVPWFALTASCADLPHIVFIVSDDLGWNDPGFRNNDQIHTPHIDTLAKDGVILDQYYVQSVCSPTRATFLTGRYPLHHTVNDWLWNGKATALPLNETLLPQKLAEAGYRTYATGKWHLGFTSWEHTPTFRGFESFVGFYSGGEDYFEHTAGAFDFRRDMQPSCGEGCSQVGWHDVNVYSTHIFTAEAVRIIQAHDPEAPLFLYLAYQAVHAPAQVPDDYVLAYRDTISDPRRQIFAGMVSAMDEGIGNVTDALQEKGMLEHTLLVFTTDNGGPCQGTPGGDFVGAENWPLRGGKHSIWEGGTRGVALLWAGAATQLLPESRRGTTASQLMHASDWFPTFCAVAGIGESCAKLPLDGVDQRGPLLNNDEAVRKEVFYGIHDDTYNLVQPYDTALRDGDGWKLIQGWGGLPDGWSNRTDVETPRYQCHGEGGKPCLNEEGNLMLFNVLEDPTERNEVSAQYPEVVQRLSARLAVLRATAVEVVGGGDTPDPTCPSYEPDAHQEQHVGHVWEPWCNPEGPPILNAQLLV